MDGFEGIWFLWLLDLIPFDVVSQMSDMNWFGWCTWDAFYTDVTAEGVRNGLESLEKGGIISEFVIIDDGWQVSKLKLITQPKSFTRQSRRDTKGIDKGIETFLPWRSSSRVIEGLQIGMENNFCITINGATASHFKTVDMQDED